MNASSEVGPEGKYLAHVTKPSCDNCGRPMQRAHRIHHGVSYCSICYPTNFPSRTCEVCGKSARSHKNNPSPVCRQCLQESRTCLRCGKLTPRADLRVGDRVACASCAPYYRPPRPCDTCGTLSSRLSRAQGFSERGQMCEKCLRKTVKATCSHCHKHRGMFFMTLAGAHLCKSCCEHGLPSHACPGCGETVGGVGLAPCLACSIKNSNFRRQAAVQPMLETPQAKQLHAEFTHWGNNTHRASKVATNASRYLEFIMRIDNALQRGQQLGQELLMQEFSTEELRRMGLLAQFLAEQGTLQLDSTARRQRSDLNLIQNKLQSSVGQSWGNALQGFNAAMDAQPKELNVRSRKAYLHAAISLLGDANVRRAEQLTQACVDGFIRKKPGLRASLGPFLTYLAQQHGLVLKTPRKKAISPPSLLPQARAVRALMDALAGGISEAARLALTAALLAKLLNADLEKILQLRHMDVIWPTGDCIRLDGQWLQLPEAVWPIVRALEAPPGTNGNSWAFPGRSFTDCLSTAAVNYHRRKHLMV